MFLHISISVPPAGMFGSVHRDNSILIYDQGSALRFVKQLDDLFQDTYRMLIFFISEKHSCGATRRSLILAAIDDDFKY